MKESWYEGHYGNRKFLPASERQGHALAQKTLFPIQAQIAVFFGQPAGTLDDLQQGVMKLAKGEPIICQCCNRNIFQEHHSAECPIAIAYKEVTSSEPVAPGKTK